MFYELAITSNFSFLQGASHPEELVVTAQKLGLSGIALCDRNTLAGVVRAHMAAKEAGLRYQPGCRLSFLDGVPDIFVWPKNIKGWNNLCRLLTTGNRRAPKGECWLKLDDLLEWGDALAMAVHLQTGDLQEVNTKLLNCLEKLKTVFGSALRMLLVPDHSATAERKTHHLAGLSQRFSIPLLASNYVLYHRPKRHRLQDVLTCIKEHVTLADAGTLLQPNAERHLKTAQEMARLFRHFPEAIEETGKLFSELHFSLDELKYQYPDEIPASGLNQKAELRRLAFTGANERYHNNPPQKVLHQIEHELALIGELKYEPYFLTVYDIVRFARSQNILCQGRGSAANSTVCYCIGITDVDPSLTDLLFERFISPERREPPDIDVDFEHERREEVIQYIYHKYGREHSALAATVITYRARSAAREVGKVFGLSEDAIGGLSGAVWGHQGSGGLGQREANQGGLNTQDITVAQVLEFAGEINGFPRHLSQHVGGFVITRDRLDNIIPMMNTAMEGRTQIEWDKDDLESLGILKIDILALGMLTCLRKAFELLESHYNRPLSLATMEKEDNRTYAMIQRADTIGVFQIESRAQMSMLPRLKPKTFYDLVIEVAIVRPGPIQGDMVHPYLRRRQGKEKVSYPSKELEEVLGRTLGVPLFQEQAMKIAIVAAGFSPGEADKLRRAMATFRRVGTIHTFQEKMVRGMTAKGYDPEFAARCFKQIEGFGEYGFPESHAASFALLVYASCWLKCHYPDAFAAAIINSQPMGFYSPAQLVRDAREHGVQIKPPDINFADYNCTLEPQIFNSKHLHRKHFEMATDIKSTHAVRLGFRQIKGLGKGDAELIMQYRFENGAKGYHSVRQLWLKTGLSRAAMEKLAEADAFRSIGLDRRNALWQVRALDKSTVKDRMPLFDFGNGNKDDLQIEPETLLPVMPESEHVIQDYRTLSLSLKGHPVSFLRGELSVQKVVPNFMIEDLPSGRFIELAGLVIVRQRPGSAKGVVFMTIEDETGIANVIVWPKVFEQFRPVVMSARLVRIKGKIQKADGITHIIAFSLEDATPMLAGITEQGLFAANQQTIEQEPLIFDSLANADEVRRPIEDTRQVQNPKTKIRALLKEQSTQTSENKINHLGTKPLGRSGMEEQRAMKIKKTSQKETWSRELKEAARVLPRGRNFH
ncbi:MAG: error-prone DNA polymerase [Salaquimonas sp.]